MTHDILRGGVNQSAWIVPGGTGDNALQEWTPYWLNGLVPLHFLLPDREDLSDQAWQLSLVKLCCLSLSFARFK